MRAAGVQYLLRSSNSQNFATLSFGILAKGIAGNNICFFFFVVSLNIEHVFQRHQRVVRVYLWLDVRPQLFAMLVDPLVLHDLLQREALLWIQKEEFV